MDQSVSEESCLSENSACSDRGVSLNSGTGGTDATKPASPAAPVPSSAPPASVPVAGITENVAPSVPKQGEDSIRGASNKSPLTSETGAAADGKPASPSAPPSPAGAPSPPASAPLEAEKPADGIPILKEGDIPTPGVLYCEIIPPGLKKYLVTGQPSAAPESGPCYCGEERPEESPDMLWCDRGCDRWFHQSCVRSLPFGHLVSGDWGYLFQCGVCGNGTEIFNFFQKSGPECVQVAMWNVLQDDSKVIKKKEFKFVKTTDFWQFLDDHWKEICHYRPKEPWFRSSHASYLSTQPQFDKYFSGSGLWRLTDFRNPKEILDGRPSKLETAKKAMRKEEKDLERSGLGYVPNYQSRLGGNKSHRRTQVGASFARRRRGPRTSGADSAAAGSSLSSAYQDNKLEFFQDDRELSVPLQVSFGGGAALKATEVLVNELQKCQSANVAPPQPGDALGSEGEQICFDGGAAAPIPNVNNVEQQQHDQPMAAQSADSSQSTGVGVGHREPRLNKPKTVVVLGAGVAGLAAAKTLVEAGVRVHIIEARRRWGGRICSYELPWTSSSSPSDPSSSSNSAIPTADVAAAAAAVAADDDGAAASSSAQISPQSPSFGTSTSIVSETDTQDAMAVELGAAFLHGCNDENPVYVLANRLGINLNGIGGGYSGGWARLALWIDNTTGRVVSANILRKRLDTAQKVFTEVTKVAAAMMLRNEQCHRDNQPPVYPDLSLAQALLQIVKPKFDVRSLSQMSPEQDTILCKLFTLFWCWVSTLDDTGLFGQAYLALDVPLITDTAEARRSVNRYVASAKLPPAKSLDDAVAVDQANAHISWVFEDTDMPPTDHPGVDGPAQETSASTIVGSTVAPTTSSAQLPTAKKPEESIIDTHGSNASLPPAPQTTGPDNKESEPPPPPSSSAQSVATAQPATPAAREFDQSHKQAAGQLQQKLIDSDSDDKLVLGGYRFVVDYLVERLRRAPADMFTFHFGRVARKVAHQESSPGSGAGVCHVSYEPTSEEARRLTMCFSEPDLASPSTKPEAQKLLDETLHGNSVAEEGPLTETIECDAVVCALPLGVLKGRHPESTVTFVPPLSADKQHAIDNVGMGVENKVVMLFDRRFWPNVPFIQPSRSVEFRIINLHFYGGPNALVVHSSPPFSKHYRLETADQVKNRALAVLRGMFPHKQIDEPVHWLTTRWGQDPFSCGSYSYLHRGATWKEIEQLAKPEAAIYFAGEACSVNSLQCVSGAMETGIECGNRLRKIFGKTTANFEGMGPLLHMTCECGFGDPSKTSLACDKCDRWYHFECAGLPVGLPAPEVWLCNDCRSSEWSNNVASVVGSLVSGAANADGPVGGDIELQLRAAEMVERRSKRRSASTFNFDQPSSEEASNAKAKKAPSNGKVKEAAPKKETKGKASPSAGVGEPASNGGNRRPDSKKRGATSVHSPPVLPDNSVPSVSENDSETAPSQPSKRSKLSSPSKISSEQPLATEDDESMV